MEFNEFCIGKECEYNKKCKLKKVEGVTKCPIYHFSGKKEIFKVDSKGYYTGMNLTMCPSCGEFGSITGMYADNIWGVICGHCLYEFAIKGYPTIQSINMLKKRGEDVRTNTFGNFKAWDIESVKVDGNERSLEDNG